MAAQWHRRQPPFTPFFPSFFSFLFSFVSFVVLSVVMPCSILHCTVCIHMDTWDLARVFPQPQSFGSLFREKPSAMAPVLHGLPHPVDMGWIQMWRPQLRLNWLRARPPFGGRFFLGVHRPQRHDVSPKYQRGYSASRQRSPEQWRPEILVYGPLGWRISSIGLQVAQMAESAY
jgi:hypothetical protein